MLILLRHSFINAERVVYTACRGGDEHLVSPSQAQSTIDAMFRYLIPDLLVKCEVVPKEICLGTIPSEPALRVVLNVRLSYRYAMQAVGRLLRGPSPLLRG